MFETIGISFITEIPIPSHFCSHCSCIPDPSTQRLSCFSSACPHSTSPSPQVLLRGVSQTLFLREKQPLQTAHAQSPLFGAQLYCIRFLCLGLFVGESPTALTLTIWCCLPQGEAGWTTLPRMLDRGVNEWQMSEK